MSSESDSDAQARAALPRQARSIATRGRLLDATVECLVDLGYSRTTTSEVCRRAGVSQGALFKHFPTKANLLAATVAHLFASLVDDFGRTISLVDDRPDRIGASVVRLWEMFRTPSLEAVFDLFIAGRTDEELAIALRPVVAAHRASYVATARALFPEAARALPHFDVFVHTLMMSLQGMAVMHHLRPEPAEAELHMIEELARAALGPFEDARRRAAPYDASPRP